MSDDLCICGHDYCSHYLCGVNASPCYACGPKVCPTYRGPFSREYQENFRALRSNPKPAPQDLEGTK